MGRLLLHGRDDTQTLVRPTAHSDRTSDARCVILRHATSQETNVSAGTTPYGVRKDRYPWYNWVPNDRVIFQCIFCALYSLLFGVSAGKNSISFTELLIMLSISSKKLKRNWCNGTN